MKEKVLSYVKRYGTLILGLFLYAFAYNLFLKPNNIVAGDVDGIANECYDIHAFEKLHYIRLAYCLKRNALTLNDNAVGDRVQREILRIIEAVCNI